MKKEKGPKGGKGERGQGDTSLPPCGIARIIFCAYRDGRQQGEEG